LPSKDTVNQAKGDKDPAEWMPPYRCATCRYIGEWTAVKIRWHHTVNSAEKTAMTNVANSCPNVTISVTYAF
jgi:hypothetical protein